MDLTGTELATLVFSVMGLVGGIEVGLAFLLRAPSVAVDDERRD